MTKEKPFGKAKNFSDYLLQYKSLQNSPEVKSKDRLKGIKIAVLSSSTIKGLKEILFVKCHEFGVIPEIFIGGYNQYNQEILDGKSELYSFKPDLVFLSIDTKSLLGDTFFDYYSLSEEEKSNLFENRLKHLKGLADKIIKNLDCKLVIHNFEVPLNSPLGIIDNKQKAGFIDFVKDLNSEINNIFRESKQVFVFDFELFCSRHGKENIRDYKMYFLGDIKISLNHFPHLCDEYVSFIKPLMSLTRKCIVLDLDNTLWGGIIGEDGTEGIKLGSTPAGRPFWEFQKYIFSLFNRGIILAINSKNNPEDALKALRNHPDMVLREQHFASIKINWEDKISNMKAIAKEINIGLDSLVFFDDDKLNREMIRTALPEVEVVDLPEDPSLYLKTLMDLDSFNSFYFSEEDKKKGQMYADQAKRKELVEASTDISEYLKALKMNVIIEHANAFNIPRISQLTQKTNQFNTTTKRYSEEDITRFSKSKDHLVFSVKVEDKFGDNGITGVAIVEKRRSEWIIDSFLLSCRVIGRRVEETMVAYIIEKAGKENAKSLCGNFIATQKNIPAKEFYKNTGFRLIEKNNGSEKWEFELEKEFNYPEFINVIKK